MTIEKILDAVGWILCRVVGLVMAAAGLACFFTVLHPLIVGTYLFDSGLGRLFGAFIVPVGCYWLWLGSRMLRGVEALAFINLSVFLIGNLFLCIAFLLFAIAFSNVAHREETSIAMLQAGETLLLAFAVAAMRAANPPRRPAPAAKDESPSPAARWRSRRHGQACP